MTTNPLRPARPPIARQRTQDEIDYALRRAAEMRQNIERAEAAAHMGEMTAHESGTEPRPTLWKRLSAAISERIGRL